MAYMNLLILNLIRHSALIRLAGGSSAIVCAVRGGSGTAPGDCRYPGRCGRIIEMVSTRDYDHDCQRNGVLRDTRCRQETKKRDNNRQLESFCIDSHALFPSETVRPEVY
jgi:hypothetical protein